MSISARLESLPNTPLLRKVLLLAGIGWLFDAMDQGMVSGVLAAIGTEWGVALTTLQLSFLSSAGILGMILGAALSGIAADRFGRRSVILATLLIFSVGSALSGLSQSYEMLLVCRFITGFGLGGELPAASTLVSEFSPSKTRGRNVIILESFWAWGWILAALVAYLAIPVFGWRVAFLFGAIPALFAAVLRFALPESPRFLELSGRTQEAEAIVGRMEAEAGLTGVAAAQVAEQGAAEFEQNKGEETATEAGGEGKTASNSPHGLVKPKVAFTELWHRPYLRSTLVLWVLWFGINFGYYGFVLWTPTLLVAQGFDLVKSFGFTLVMCLAQLPGYLCAAILIEKIGRKPVLAIFLLGTALAALFCGLAGGEAQNLNAGCLLYFFALGAWGCVYSYTPELYPTRIRGLGTGWAAAFGRVGALVAPLLVPLLYGSLGTGTGFVAVFVVLTVIFVLVALVVGIFGKETRGTSLE
jgi:putative MFS transporter